MALLFLITLGLDLEIPRLIWLDMGLFSNFQNSVSVFMAPVPSKFSVLAYVQRPNYTYIV